MTLILQNLEKLFIARYKKPGWKILGTKSNIKKIFKKELEITF